MVRFKCSKFGKLIYGENMIDMNSITPLPLLDIRPQVQFECKCRPRLGMQVPIGIRNLIRCQCLPKKEIKCRTYSIRTQLGILVLEGIALRARDVDDSVNDDMRHMNALRSEFPSK